MMKSNRNSSKVIKDYLNKDNRRPVIILIAGMHGVGKTTLAFYLSRYLNIKQRIGLGTIVKTLEFFSDKEDVTRKADSLKIEDFDWNLLNRQAKIICGAINNIIFHAIQDGVDCIIEGIQLVPKYLKMDDITLLVFLKSPPIAKYTKRLNHPSTHRTRIVLHSKVIELKKLEEQFLESIMNNPKVVICENESISKKVDNILLNLAKNIRN